MNSPDLVSAGLAPLSRRGFLRTLTLTGMALTTGCASLSRRDAVADQPPVAARLTDEETLILTRLTAVLLPTAAHGLPDSRADVPTVENINAMAAHMSPQTRELMGMVLWVFERRPMASFRFSRFSRLDDERALAYVQAMQNGTFFERGVMTALTTLVCVNYWRDSQTWPALDYHGPVTSLWGIRRLGNAPMPTV